MVADTDTVRDANPFHFVPDELCVVLTIEAREKPETILDRDWQRRLYDAVREALDTILLAELPRAARDAGGDDPIRRDLAPRRLLDVAKERGQLLTDLRRGKYARPAVAGTPLGGEPWVVLPRTGRVQTALLFFGLAAGDHRADPDGQGLVREAVNLCNRAYRRRPLPLPDDLAQTVAVRVEAGTPNWFTGAAQVGMIGGGPGSGPEPVAASEVGGAQFGQFTVGSNAALSALLPPADRTALNQEAPGDVPEVIVAVLDTCPADGKAQIKRKLAEIAPGDHWLLRELLESPHVHLDDPTFIDPSYRWDYSVNWGRWSAPRPAATATGGSAQHEMPDHGLFAAGIVRTLAPGAELRLIRVLDDYGVGDLLALAQVLALLPAALLGEGPLDPPGKRRLIVNLSLTASLPPDALLLDLWFPEAVRSARHPELLRRRFNEISITLAAIQRSLRVVVDWLAARDNVLLVAAAGNDGQLPSGRPAPAVPARYDSVLGVGALRADGDAARFSNRGDIAVFGNGVAIFGGNVQEDHAGDLGVIDTAADGLPDAVVGAALAPTLPPQGVANETGWARWAGTSFAAPIVSGLAAALWSQPATSGLAAADVIGAVVGIAGTDAPDLDCAALSIKQVR
jgi:subtilisin family serine protease